MKLIHCADIHLGSALDGLPMDKAEERRRELREAFSRLVSCARNSGVKVIMLAGDVFDSDRPLRRDKEFFYGVVRANPDIDFLYIRGNHDGRESYVDDSLENLKLFVGEWGCYSYGNVRIYGAEMPKDGAASLAKKLVCDGKSFNIVMLHGQVGSEIKLTDFRDKNIDYLALGHIHSYSAGKLDERGTYAYCGCLEGRGFDETGEKGFILVDTDSRKYDFVPFAGRTVRFFSVNISGVANPYEAFKRVTDGVKFARKDLLRVELTGEIDFTDEKLAREVEGYLGQTCFFASVKDKTEKKLDISAIREELSLRGEFVRAVCADKTIAEEDKPRVIKIGLNALKSGEVEL